MKFILYVVVLILVAGCTSVSDRQLEAALQMAGENRIELEKVLKHYEYDTLKLKAARFLIENMPYHHGINDRILDHTGKEYFMDLSKYRGEDEIRQTYDSLLKMGYHIERVLQKDIENLTAIYLIENIDLAFEVRNKKWTREIPFYIFCKYILPYRVSNEPLSKMRKVMISRYMKIMDSIAPNSPEEACLGLNKYLKKKIRFKGFSPFYNSIEYVDQYKWGNCEGLAVYFTFLARALGIPCCVESTQWTKNDAGHSWCALIDGSGKAHPFGAAELSFEEFKHVFSRRNMIPAKVYRKEYQAFFSNILEDDGYVTYLKNPTLHDVTKEYAAKTFNLEINLKEFSVKDGMIVYLCGYNGGNWKEVALGSCYASKAMIKDVVGDNIFRLAKSDDGRELSFLTDPFYVDSLGVVEQLEGMGMKSIVLDKSRINRKKTFCFSYWNNRSGCFYPCSKVKETDSIIVILAPKGGLIQYSFSHGQNYGRLLLEKEGVILHL